jgi:Ser-tRNA(Ala) deacylase AlaX
MKSYDPQMHSAEHILNQTMVRMFGCERSFSSHIEKKKSKCDYHFERALTQVEENDLTSQINHIIEKHLDITEKQITLEAAKRSYNLKRLPEESGDAIRIVSVGDYDDCPCIGPHVRNTSEIGKFQMVSTSFEEGILRIRFKLQ